MIAINLAAPLAALFGWPLLIFALAVFSITRLITEDTIADKLRNWFFVHFPHEGFQSKKRPKRGEFTVISQGVYYVHTGTYLGKLISCPWCTGFWVSLGLFAAFVAWPIGTTFVLTPLALRVAAGALMAWTD